MHRRLPTAGIEVAPHYHQLLVTAAPKTPERRIREKDISESTRSKNPPTAVDDYLLANCTAVSQNHSKVYTVLGKSIFARRGYGISRVPLHGS